MGIDMIFGLLRETVYNLSSRHGLARLGMAGHGEARLGSARLGKARSTARPSVGAGL